MSAPVFVGSGFVAQYPEGGGNFWVPLQYLLGLRSAGIEAYWLEFLRPSAVPAHDARCRETFLGAAAQLGVGDRVCLLQLAGEGEHFALHGALGRRALEERMRAGILLSFANSAPPGLRARFARRVLYDIDPGMFQLWAREWDMGVRGHDVHLTIGQSVGRPGCPVPVGEVTWHPIWPTVHLPAWPVQEGAGARYTTVTQWWNGGGAYDVIDGETYEHNKRASWLDVIDLPRRTGLALELAANITPGEGEDRALLERHGWRLVHPHEVAGTPLAYRDYVQSSRGELSCAKPSYVKTSPGWLSDRTLCYLASGRPCVVQGAGAERHLPRTAGLQFFATLQEAAEALGSVEADPAGASRAARALAEEVFSTRVVIPRLLKLIGA